MIQGSIVALVTPMLEDGSLDFGCLDRLIEFHIDQGSDALIGVGTTGESATVNEEEHCAIIRRMVKTAAGRIPIIGGTGSNSTREAIDLTRCAHEAGADACLLVTPYYNKPTQEGLYLHHKAVAEAVAVPQILYNVPGRTACDMLPETIERLSSIENIVGVKEATGELERGVDIRQRCGDGFAIYSGDDATAMEFMLAGANGNISVTANIAPKIMHDMCAAAMNGERDSATQLNDQVKRLHDVLFVEANPIPVKWALQEQGLIPDGIRLPMTPLSAEFHDDIRSAMKLAGVLE